VSAIDDQNDALRARVEAAMGAMPQGLSEDDRDEWSATADRLFFQFCDDEYGRADWQEEQAQFYQDKFSPSTVFRFSSGAVAYQNRKGRCEDAPCCGCCS
tara:strand:- start:249 stop:548 length:300 start_codon:yes stop_codon:yes gene_type:complete